MALRLRRALSVSSSFLKLRPLPRTHLTRCTSSFLSNASGIESVCQLPVHHRVSVASFHSSGAGLFSSRFNDTDKITDDTILFEGCDYNHWLITMDFPKDPKPTPEQMVETYVQTCAKGLGCSIEEAKKKIYACSTTTYQGFQAVMTEEESEKFRGLPGVVFILPDSYIDPVNKEYGGDKYINGTIIPRPPPVQYRSTRRDNRPRFDRQSRDQMSTSQGGQYDRQGPTQSDGRSYAPRPNYGPPPTQQNYGPPSAPQNYGPPPSQQNYGPPPSQQNYRPPPPNYGPPPPQQNYGPPPPQQNYGPPPPQQNYGPPPSQQNYGPPPSQHNYGQPPPQQNYGAPPPSPNYGPPGQNDGRGYGTPGGRDYSTGGFQGERPDVMPPDQGGYSHGARGNFPIHEQKFWGPGSAPTRDNGLGRDLGYDQGFAGPTEGQEFKQSAMRNDA
ncbi:hypothetical protein H6P81_001730 [Aristolochia fimbriata]|uniref:MORF/ORRM1/DAG-like MORF domain-containing protein n=1 Tax=Aristolochia fimbriata TaxID=158543 RepID=A0AAV7F7T3_ARIFI|nr:hypothetical protein H6P81_001730 [Aristolochia fimbriata]